MKKAITAVIVLILLCMAWYFLFPAFKTTELHEDAPQTSETLQNGFQSQSLGIISESDLVPGAHEVEGKVELIEAIDSNIYLRFESLSIINGPDVRVQLSADLNHEDFVDLGQLKATHGDFNYVVPETVNLEKYSKVLIWCDDFSVLFAYADFAK